jgi:2',3'-cyclic-nucleotide 2'-phosphodiesterase (5'-nucleotidase family)
VFSGLIVIRLRNHDFDLGFNHLTKLVKDTTFPWLLSNVIDTDTSKTPETLHEFYVIEKAGIKIGVIGLVEKYALFYFAFEPRVLIAVL